MSVLIDQMNSHIEETDRIVKSVKRQNDLMKK